MQVAILDQDPKLSPKDFISSQEVKWCPGCGDYSILKQVQTVFPDLGVPKEDFVFISGIGCSSRFTYYMDTYGMHSIHGRAVAIAEGVKIANPKLSVWVISGDGDSMSIGGNHFIHAFRRNLNLHYLMFNNQIYSLTKGQYSPTSEKGKVTKTSPQGSVEEPFNPAELALGAHASFVARTLDRDPKHMQVMLKRAHAFQGTSFVEVYQNCPIFNDGAFFSFSDKESKSETAIQLEHGKPLIFGLQADKGIKLDGLNPKVVSLKEDGITADELWIHDEEDKTKAGILARFSEQDTLPRPFGVLFARERVLYEDALEAQIQTEYLRRGHVPLEKILSGTRTWEII